MKLEQRAVSLAAGTILAHSIKDSGISLKKGHILTPEDLRLLEAGGYAMLTVVVTDAGDIGENEAAARLAGVLSGPGIRADKAFTGRCNLKSVVHGLLCTRRDSVDRINLVHESITLATLEPYSVIHPGQLVATVKIIPFAVPADILAACVELAEAAAPMIRVAPFKPKRIGFIQTRLPGMQESLLNKTTRVLEKRLTAVQGNLAMELRCRHDSVEISQAIARLLDLRVELIIVAAASAIIDREDVVPTAIIRAGGEIMHFGMPVDPGNLLLLAKHGHCPVVGMPGCARSPSLNGFDWVLERLAAEIPLSARDIMVMGTGGLLKEIGNRPQPRLGGSERESHDDRT